MKSETYEAPHFTMHFIEVKAAESERYVLCLDMESHEMGYVSWKDGMTVNSYENGLHVFEENKKFWEGLGVKNAKKMTA